MASASQRSGQRVRLGIPGHECILVGWSAEGDDIARLPRECRMREHRAADRRCRDGLAPGG